MKEPPTSTGRRLFRIPPGFHRVAFSLLRGVGAALSRLRGLRAALTRLRGLRPAIARLRRSADRRVAVAPV